MAQATTDMNDLGKLPILLSPKMVAPIVGKTPKGVRDLCILGELPAVKVGNVWRIRRDELLKMLGFR